MATLATLFDLLLVVLGFSLLILVHELGHYLAARWAGIRVLAFAMGFGKALVSYRPGLGWRRGSSEREYAEALKTSGVATTSISPTEYRLNALPFGGYVKMLGQEDGDPGAVSDASDSYTRASIGKRMVVISAGVIANMITAMVLFVIVFSVGLRAEPATLGGIDPAGPASRAVLESTSAESAPKGTLETAGLRPGDQVIAINREPVRSFKDIVMASVMNRRGDPMRVDVRRPGAESTLSFLITPEMNEQARVQTIGVEPARSGRIVTPTDDKSARRLRASLDAAGLANVSPGMTLADGLTPMRLEQMIRDGRGRPISVKFVSDNSAGTTSAEAAKTITIVGVPKLDRSTATVTINGTPQPFEFGHVGGLTPVLSVFTVEPGDAGDRAGLRPHDVIARIGEVEWPSVPVGIATIRAAAGKVVPLVVAREVSGSWTLVDLGKVEVSREGRIGFSPTDSSVLAAFVTRFPGPATEGERRIDVTLPIGARIVKVGDTPVPTLRELKLAFEQVSQGKGTTTLSWQPASSLRAGSAIAASGEAAEQSPLVQIPSSRAPIGFEPPTPLGQYFEIDQIVLKSDGPIGAVGMGLKETRYMMVQAYTTLVRLVQGTIKVEHLQGPVGIAHTGVRIADRGFIWMLFFFAMISVNLAVLNYLPLPIVDGGHMLFLIYEWMRGKPPPIAVQNAAALAGLAVIGLLFIVVTAYNIRDVVRDLVN
jgi:regulator of sigma E protease